MNVKLRGDFEKMIPVPQGVWWDEDKCEYHTHTGVATHNEKWVGFNAGFESALYFIVSGCGNES